MRPGGRVGGESRPTPRCRESEVQILDADGTGFDGLESRACEQFHDLRNIDVTVPMAEVPREAVSLRLGSGEVDEEYPAARLDDSAQLGRKLPTGGPPEVMKHHRAERQIEARVRKRQGLSGGILESDLDARPRRLRARPGQH